MFQMSSCVLFQCINFNHNLLLFQRQTKILSRYTLVKCFQPPRILVISARSWKFTFNPGKIIVGASWQERGRWHWFLHCTVQLLWKLLHCDYFWQAVTQMDLTTETRKVKGRGCSKLTRKKGVLREKERREMVGTLFISFARLMLKADRKSKQRWVTSARENIFI